MSYSSHFRKTQVARLEELANSILELDALLALTPSPDLYMNNTRHFEQNGTF